MVSLEDLFLFGVTPALIVSGVWGTFKLLKFNTPLKYAVLESLTNPNRAPEALLREQYLIVREAVLGSRPFTRRRIVLAIGIVGLWIAALGLFKLITPKIFLGFVADQYFSFAVQHPPLYLLLVAVTIAIFLAVIDVFDFVLSSIIFRRNGVILNVFLLSVAYLLSVLVALLFTNICADTFYLTANEVPVFSLSGAKMILISAVERLGRFVMNPSSSIALIFGSLTILFEPFDSESVIGITILQGVQHAVILLSTLAILPMLMTSIFALSILHIAYFVGLFFVRVDLFLRERFIYDQDAILDDPVGYLGRVACCVAVAIVLLVNLAAIGFSRSMNSVAPSGGNPHQSETISPLA